MEEWLSFNLGRNEENRPSREAVFCCSQLGGYSVE